jgi:photosystem II stability/assembly factor-like uncharacterized protein
MRAPASQAAAPLRAALVASALCAATAMLAGQDATAIRGVAAGPLKSISTYGAVWSDAQGSGWSDSGAWPSRASTLNFGMAASDGTGNGEPWQVTGSVLGLCFAAAAPYQGWAVGNGALLLRTRDGGASWTAQSAPVPNDLYAVACVSATVAVAVGTAGTIIRTGDGGATWTKVTVPSWTGVDLFCVSFSDSTHGIATGLNGQVIASMDGGLTWADIRPTIASGQRTLNTLTACNAPAGSTMAFVGGTGGVIMSTANYQAGSSAAVAFTQVLNGTSGVLAAAGDPGLAFPYTAVTGIASANAGQNVWFTTTGGGIVALTGSVWSTQRQGATGNPHLRGIAAADATHLYAVGNSGTVLKSSNGVAWVADPGYVGAATTGTSDIVAIAIPAPGSPPPPPSPSPPPPLSPPSPPPKPPPKPPAPPNPPPSPPPYPVVYKSCDDSKWLRAFIAVLIIAILLLIALIAVCCYLCAVMRRPRAQSGGDDREAAPYKERAVSPTKTTEEGGDGEAAAAPLESPRRAGSGSRRMPYYDVRM